MKSPTGAQIHIFEDLDSLAAAFAHELSELIIRRAGEQGLCSLALTGGETPGPLYRRVADEQFQRPVPWDQVKIFFGDERPVGPEDHQSNFRLAWENWLSRSTIPREAIFRMEGEAADLARAADRYSECLTHELPSSGGFPALDLILLGLGPDGHIASLFPGTEALNETLRLVVANEVPQLDTRRLTLTLPVINAAREIWFLVTGESKARIAAECLGLVPVKESHPAALVHPVGGHVRWWLDRAAATHILERQHEVG